MQREDFKRNWARKYAPPPLLPPDGVGRERVWRMKRKPILLTCNLNKKDENNLLRTVGALEGNGRGEGGNVKNLFMVGMESV